MPYSDVMNFGYKIFIPNCVNMWTWRPMRRCTHALGLGYELWVAHSTFYNARILPKSNTIGVQLLSTPLEWNRTKKKTVPAYLSHRSTVHYLEWPTPHSELNSHFDVANVRILYVKRQYLPHSLQGYGCNAMAPGTPLRHLQNEHLSFCAKLIKNLFQ